MTHTSIRELPDGTTTSLFLTTTDISEGDMVKEPHLMDRPWLRATVSPLEPGVPGILLDWAIEGEAFKVLAKVTLDIRPGDTVYLGTTPMENVSEEECNYLKTKGAYRVLYHTSSPPTAKVPLSRDAEEVRSITLENLATMTVDMEKEDLANLYETLANDIQGLQSE